MSLNYLGRTVTLADGPGDGSAHEVTSAGVPYAIPAGHVGVILDDGRVIAVDPAVLTVADIPTSDPTPAPKAAPAPKAKKWH